MKKIIGSLFGVAVLLAVFILFSTTSNVVAEDTTKPMTVASMADIAEIMGTGADKIVTTCNDIPGPCRDCFDCMVVASWWEGDDLYINFACDCDDGCATRNCYTDGEATICICNQIPC